MPIYLWYNTTRSIRRALSARSGYTVRELIGFSLPPKDHISARAPQQHGATYIDTFYRPRQCGLVITVAGCSAEDFQAKHRELVRAMNPLDASELRIINEAQVLYTLTCRPVAAMEVRRHNSRIADVLVQLIADDPFFHTAQETTDFASAITTGLLIPFTIPALISSTTNRASLTVTNNGHALTYPIVTINGLCTNPQIINDTTGESLTVSETVAAGSVLTVDMGARTAIITSAGGTTNVLGSVSGNFWALARGANAIRVTSDDGVILFIGNLAFTPRYLAVI